MSSLWIISFQLQLQINTYLNGAGVHLAKEADIGLINRLLH